jgi:hypothetical protein
MNHTTR